MEEADAAVLESWRERIATAVRGAMPLRLRGAGTKDFYGEQLSGEITPVEFHEDSPGSVLVRARRIDRWRSTGEIATERDIEARFSLADGAITRVEMS